MSYSLNSLMVGYIGIIIIYILYGTIIRLFKGDTRSLDYSSCRFINITCVVCYRYPSENPKRYTPTL